MIQPLLRPSATSERVGDEAQLTNCCSSPLFAAENPTYLRMHPHRPPRSSHPHGCNLLLTRWRDPAAKGLAGEKNKEKKK